MSERCPVCGADYPDRTEAWLHFRQVHGGPPARRAGPPGAQPAAAGDASTGDTSTGDTSTGDTSTGDTSTGDAPTGDAPPARPGGILRQGWQDGPVTMVIIGITLAAWLLDRALHYGPGIELTHALSGNGLLGTDGQWWRLITPVLVHFGPLHIIFNMLWVYQLGPAIERLMGKAGFIGTYLATGVAGNVCSDLVYWHRPVMSGGASGAVYGLGGVLVGAWGAAKLLARSHPGPPPPGSLRFNDQAVRSLAMLFGAYLVIGFLFLPIDNAAHFGGGLLGLIIGGGLAWQHNRPRPVAPAV